MVPDWLINFALPVVFSIFGSVAVMRTKIADAERRITILEEQSRTLAPAEEIKELSRKLERLEDRQNNDAQALRGEINGLANALREEIRRSGERTQNDIHSLTDLIKSLVDAMPARA